MPKVTANPDLGPHRWWPTARYVGGHSKFSQGWVGYLFFTTKAIGLGKTHLSGPQETVIPMETVANIQITGQQVAKSKVAPVLMFGVLGLGAKGWMYITTVVVRTKDGETAYWEIADQTPETVRALLTPLLKRVDVPFYDEGPAPTAAGVADFADQLRKLAALRDEGLLTDSEFEIQKAQLLATESSPRLPPSPPASPQPGS